MPLADDAGSVADVPEDLSNGRLLVGQTSAVSRLEDQRGSIQTSPDRQSTCQRSLGSVRDTA